MPSYQVHLYQTHLAKAGLYPFAAIDGINGPVTISAIKHFQALIGQVQTGVLTPTQARQLYSFGNPARKDDMDTLIPYPHDDTEALTAFYGMPGMSVERQLVKKTIPYPLEVAWQPGVYVNTITMHSLCVDAFVNLFDALLAAYGRANIRGLKLDQYGGAYTNRNIRGGTRASTHAYGCALDLAPAQNQLNWAKPKALFSHSEYDAFHRSVKSAGLTNLGAARNYDYMHIQAAWL